MRWHSRAWAWVGLAVAALVVETSLWTFFFPPGYAPDLILALVVILSFYETPRRGLWLGAVMGLIQDVWVGRLIGLHAVTLAAVGGGVAYLQRRLVHDRLFVPGLLAGVATGVAGLAEAALMHLAAVPIPWNAVLGPLAYRMLTAMLLAPALGEILGIKAVPRIDYRRSRL
ncbi:MAG: rod shape-determining protein MreD [Firmicutes bacterium]|nr:rod shape-determining protein MreD [Alicyclobacillaceae bacterium]MCL6496984.1 rod shape-determining protein MreD [Bacillota bacterium]